MNLLKRVSRGTTTHSDSGLIVRGIAIILVIGIAIGFILGTGV